MPIAVRPRLDEAHQLSASLIQTPTFSGRSQPEWQRNGWFYPLGHNLTRPFTIGSILHGVHAPAEILVVLSASGARHQLGVVGGKPYLVAPTRRPNRYDGLV